MNEQFSSTGFITTTNIQGEDMLSKVEIALSLNSYKISFRNNAPSMCPLSH